MATKQYDAYSDLITFTRASTGTYLDSDGLLKTATTNTPRIEYDADGNRLGLLIEEARTNLVLYSEDATNWTEVGTTTITNSTQIAPDGTASATLVDIGATGSSFGPNRISETATGLSAGSTYTASVFFKRPSSNAAEYISVRVFCSGTVNTDSYLNYNTLTGQASDLSGDVLTANDAVDVGNGWWRASFSFLLDASATGFFDFRIGGPLLAKSISNTDFIMWGLQLEEGSFPTSYIPTAGVAASRSADVASIPTSAFGYNQKAGTVVVDFETQYGTTGFPRIWEIGNTSTSVNRVIGYISASTSAVRCAVLSNNVSVADFSVKTDPTPASGKLAFAFADDDFAALIDGGSPVTDTSGSFTTPSTPRNTLKIGGAGDSSSANMSGHIKSIQYYPRRLTNAQLQRLTS